MNTWKEILSWEGCCWRKSHQRESKVREKLQKSWGGAFDGELTRVGNLVGTWKGFLILGLLEANFSLINQPLKFFLIKGRIGHSVWARRLLHCLEFLIILIEVDSFVLKKMGLGQWSGSKSWVCHLLVLRTVANYLTSLRLDFFNYRINNDINIDILIFIRITFKNLC